MNNKLKAIDAEYIIKRDPESNKMILGVLSKELNASCWMRINNEYLSKATIESIWTDLETMESSMVYQTLNGL